MYWRVDPDINHNASNGLVPVTIAKATYDRSHVSFVSRVFKYDGTEHSLAITGTLPDGVTVTYDNNGRTEVGTVKVWVNFHGDEVNYEPMNKWSADLTVKVMSIEHEAQGYSGVYDGLAHSITVTTEVAGATIYYSESEGGPYVTQNPAYSASGTHDVYYKITCPEHDDEYGLMKVKINAIALTLISGSASKVYDGMPLTLPGVTVIGDVAEGQTLEASAIGQIKDYDYVGETNTIVYTITDSEGHDVSSNYVVVTQEGILTIERRNVDIFIVEAGPFTYDGTAKTLSYRVEGLLGTDTIYAYLGYDGNHTDVGTYTVYTESYEFVSGYFDNYDVNDLWTEELVIVPQSVAVPSADATAYVYNGSEQTYVIAQSPLYSVAGNVRTDAGSYDVTVALNDKSNYVWSTGGTADLRYTFDISRMDITVSTGTATKVYDASALECRSAEVVSGTLPEGQIIDLEGSVFASITDAGNAPNVATVVIKSGSTDVTANYNITYQNGTLTVTKRQITVSTADCSKVYDGTPLIPEVTIIGTFAGNDGIDAHGMAVTDYTGGPVTDVIAYVFTGNELNYTVKLVPGTITVTKRTLTVTATPVTVVYGDLPDFGYTYSGNIDGQTPLFRGELIIEGRDVGVHDLTSSLVLVDNGDFLARNYTIEFHGENAVTIQKRAVTFASDGGYRVYDGTPLTVTSVKRTAGTFAYDESFSYTVTGTITDAGTAENTFTYTAIKGSADNYDITLVFGTLTVDRRTLNVTADSVTGKYGEPMPVFTYTYSGNVASEVPGFTGSLTSTGSDVDTYSVDIGTLALVDNGSFKASNYIMSFTGDHRFTVLPRQVTLTSATLEVTYDGQIHQGNSVTVSGDGFVSGQGFDYSGFRSPKDVGVYENSFIYAAQAGTNPSNYSITAEFGTVTVKKATLTVTADDVGKVYGDDQPQFTYTYEGNVEDEIPGFAGSLASDHTDAGTYAITVGTLALKDNDTFKASNYEMSFVSGTYTISKRQVTITSGDAEAVYSGFPLTERSVTYTGTFAEGDSVEIDYPADVTDVGSDENYFIYQFKTGNPQNYEITKVYGTLTVTPRALTVTADAVSKVYGSPTPELTYTYSGQVTGETPGFTGAPAVSSEDAGSNDVIIGTLALADNDLFKASNYTIAFNGAGRYTVTPLPVDAPALVEELIYTGSVIVAYPDTEYYIVQGGSATEVGTYTAKLTLRDIANYAWSDSGTSAVREMPFVIISNEFEPVFTVYSGSYDYKEHVAVTVVDSKDSTVTFSTDGTTWSEESPSFTEAGTYTVYIRAEKPQYVTFETSAQVVIGQRAFTDRMVIYENVYPYDGSVKDLIYWVFDLDAYEYIDESEYTIEGTLTATDTGEYHAYVKTTGKNFSGYIDMLWKIYARGVTLPITPVSVEYTGSEMVILENTDLYYVVNGSATEVGSYSAIVNLWDPDNYYWEGTGGNESRYIHYAIVPAQFAIEVRGYSGIFDGQEHDAIIVADDADSMLMFLQPDGSWSSVMPKVRNVSDSGTVCVKGVKPNYQDTQVYEVEVSIGRLAVDEPAAEIGLVYTGEPIVVIPEGVYYDVEGGTVTEPGEYTAIVTLREPDNTEWATGGTEEKYIPFKIYEQEPPVLMVPYSGVYDGQEHAAFEIVKMVEGTVITYELEDGTITHDMPYFRAAGPYIVVVDAVKEGYAEFHEVSKIRIIPVEVPVPQPVSGLVYDGTPKTALSSTDVYQVENGTNVLPGTYVATVSLKDKDGYVWADTLTKEDRNIEYEIGGVCVEYMEYFAVYDGYYHDAVTVTEAYGATIEYSFDMADWTSQAPRVKDAVEMMEFYMKATRGSYEAHYRLYANIDKAPLTLTADDKTISVKDPLPEFTFTAEGLKGKDTVKDLQCTIEFRTTYVPGKDGKGTYPVYDDDALVDKNYDITTKNGTLSVSQHYVTVEWVYTEYIYTGEVQRLYVNVIDDEGDAVTVSYRITDLDGQDVEFKDLGTYMAYVILPEGYSLDPNVPGNTDSMELTIVSNEAFEFDWTVVSIVVLVVTISLYLAAVIVRKR